MTSIPIWIVERDQVRDDTLSPAATSLTLSPDVTAPSLPRSTQDANFPSFATPTAPEADRLFSSTPSTSASLPCPQSVSVSSANSTGSSVDTSSAEFALKVCEILGCFMFVYLALSDV